VYRRWLRDSCSRIQLKVVFRAGRAVPFAGVLIAQAGELVASADAIAVTGFRSRLDRDKCHTVEIIRFR
jgi:hypothetical protein